MINSKNAEISFFEAFILWQGRIGRKLFLQLFFLILLAYMNCILITSFLGLTLSPYVSLLFFYVFIVLYIKRLHDTNHSGFWLLWALIPVIGLIYVNFVVLFRKDWSNNQYGTTDCFKPIDYYQNPSIEMDQNKLVVNDVTQMNPILVQGVITPQSTKELVYYVKNSDSPLSIGGGRFSMGGHTASDNTIHIDMRCFNKILEFSPTQKTIRVQTGARWCDLQSFIDPFGLSIKIMQTYTNFTVGGSLSVNVHGRYIGLGAMVMSVNNFKILLANGDILEASPQKNKDVFYAAIGGYGGLGIITEVELQLSDNTNLIRFNKRMPVSSYQKYFKQTVKSNPNIVFHNADIYPKKFKNVNAVSWFITDQKANKSQLQKPKRIHPLAMYCLWAISMTPLGKWRREHIIDRPVKPI